MFRDESERIIRNARQKSKSINECLDSPFSSADSEQSSQSNTLVSRISHPLSQSVDKLGVSFFFAKFTLNEPPFSRDYNDWLTQSYLEDETNHVLRPAIDAVGLAAMSNVFHAPNVASQSKERYSHALVAMNRALSDPVQMVADTTFMAVILLGLFEVCLHSGTRIFSPSSRLLI